MLPVMTSWAIRSLAGFLGLLALFSSVVPARALVEIRELDGNRRIRIELKDATAEEVLAELARRYSFKIALTGTISGPQRLTATYEGAPLALIRRLLRHHNHLLQMSPASPIGIGRIVIVGLVGSASPSRQPPTDGRPPLADGGRPLPPGQPLRRPPAGSDDGDAPPTRPSTQTGQTPARQPPPAETDDDEPGPDMPENEDDQ